MIVERPNEIRKIKEIPKWILIYGRRKTGKTFLVRNFIKYNEYFFIKKDRGVLDKNNRQISYEVFVELIVRSLEKEETVVVDEFHRLEPGFFDLLHSMKKKGKLILLSSTLYLSKKLISKNSPLLGLFAEIPVTLLSLEDTLRALKKYKLDKKEMLELAILLREPIAIDYFDEKKKARELIAEIVLGSLKTIPALVGEIFGEEEREISAVYEGILRGVSSGKVSSGEISSYLFSKKLIGKDDPSVIQQYLNNLIYFGIIRRINIFNKKRFAYKIESPLARIYYYVDEKYNLTERKVGEKELELIINELMPRIVEDNVREFLAEKYDLIESIIESKDYDIDGCLLKFNKVNIALEVKWGKIDNKDLLKAEENLNKIESEKKILFVQDRDKVKPNLKVLDVLDLVG